MCVQKGEINVIVLFDERLRSTSKQTPCIGHVLVLFVMHISEIGRKDMFI